MSYADFAQKEITPEMKALLRQAGDDNFGKAMAAQTALAAMTGEPLQQGILHGDILGNVFTAVQLEEGAAPEFPLDLLAPSAVRDFIAYTIPGVGRIPEHHVEGDYVMVPTYDLGASIDYAMKYAKHARWDIKGRAMQVLEGMFIRKLNADGWHTLLAAGKGRGLSLYDDQVASGFMSKRLVSILEIAMRRNAGGNSTSQNRGQLTDLYMSPEAHQDVLSWDLTQIPDSVRQQIFTNWGNGGITQIGRVKLHDLDELGDNQDFQNYFENTLAGTMPTDKVEIVVGLDLLNRDSFVMPVSENLQIFPDPMFHRQRRVGFYGWMSVGFASLDSRRVVIGNV